MRKTVACLALVACAHAPSSETAFAVGTPEPAGLLPAGTCGFNPYLGDACTEAPRYAVVTLRTSDPRAAERALHAAPRFAGDPFAESFDVLPAADAKVRGLGVFAGLFRERRDADSYARALHAEVVALTTIDEFQARQEASGDFDAHERSIVRAVQTSGETPAYAESDLERVERELDERLVTHWTKMPAQQERRVAELSKLKPLCTVAADRVFATDQLTLFRFRRMYAPVTCEDGRRAWVPWRATRLESAFVGERVHQVILVECDVPTLETRAPGPPSRALGPLTDDACD